MPIKLPHPLLPSSFLPLLPILLLTTLVACGGESTETAEELDTLVAPPVEALVAREGTLPLEERLNGVVRADNQVVVRPEISGRVVEVLVRSGDSVERGQALVRIDPQSPREQLRQSEADLRLARGAASEAKARVAELDAEVTRTRELAEAELVSALDLETLEARLDAAQASAEQADARVEQAEASVEERRVGLERAVVRAPTDGRVGRRGVEVGTMVDPGTALFVVGDLDDLVVEIPLTESMLAYVEEGQTVHVAPRTEGRATESGAKGEPITATLSRISPFLEAGSFTTTGEIDLDGEAARRLRPGMFVTVDVLYGESERATLVPSSALWEDPRTGIEGVYVFTQTPEGVDATSDPGGPGDEGGLSADDIVSPTTDAPPVDPSAESFAVELRAVDVVAEGRSVVGVRGVEPGDWVVVVGQNLLAAAESPRARVRAASWERVAALQGLQREDLLASFLDKQQRLARERGARPPSNEEFLRGKAPGSGESR